MNNRENLGSWKQHGMLVVSLLFVTAVFLVSCATGPDPAVNALQQEKDKVVRERDQLSSEAASLREDKRRLESDVASLKGDKQRLESEIGKLQAKVDRLNTEMDGLKQLKGAAGADYERRLELASIELDSMKAHALQLESEIARMKNEIAVRDVSIRDLKRENEILLGFNERLRRDLTAQSETLKNEVAALSGDLNAARAKIAELERDRSSLQAALERETARLNEAEASLRQALKEEIERGNIEVNRFENVLIVSLRENILFAPDRAELNPRFERLLLEVARVFDRLPEKVIRVEGHTAIAPSRWPSSWDLGAARAVSVVRFFQEKGRIDPTRLVAVSFGEYRPVSPNDNEENRQRNRRVEISLINRPLYETQSLRQAGVIQ